MWRTKTSTHRTLTRIAGGMVVLTLCPHTNRAYTISLKPTCIAGAVGASAVKSHSEQSGPSQPGSHCSRDDKNKSNQVWFSDGNQTEPKSQGDDAGIKSKRQTRCAWCTSNHRARWVSQYGMQFSQLTLFVSDSAQRGYRTTADNTILSVSVPDIA